MHLRFDIRASSLPEYVRERLLGLRDRRITRDGVIVIKAQSHRTQEKNRAEALQRLDDLLEKALFTEKKRTPTKPGRNARKKRTDQKTRRGKVKVLRGKIRSHE